MALPITIPYTFATQSGSIPLSQLDTDISTLANAVNGIGNGTNALSNVSITGGTITNATVSNLAAAIVVADGGTGTNTITANAVVLGNGTGAIKTVAPGTNGNVLVSNGTVWLSQAITTGTGFGNWQIFSNVGTSTFTVPAGVTKVKVTVVGGGGGGGPSASSYSGGGGGGTAIKIITGLTPLANVTVTVGSGGVLANAGTTSSFGAYCSASGGGYGASDTPGVGGIGSSGDLNIGGQSGMHDYDAYATGGSSFMGGGGAYGANGRQYGGGGGAGANGASGIVIVEY